jgi:Core-2/I-Branching enzyme
MSPRRFKLGIVVLAYNRPQQLAILLATLRHPQVTTYLHIDSRTDIRPFRRALADARVSDVVWVRRHRSSWGSIGIVDAELDGIARAVADGCAYVLLISGEDFPLRPVAEIVSFAEANRGRSFVETFTLGDANGGWPRQGRERTEFYAARVFGRPFTCVPYGEDTSGMKASRRLLNWGLRARFMAKPARRFPPYLAPFGGSQWLNLAAGAAGYVLDFVRDHSDYREYHAYTVCPDELFLQSIMLGTGFAETHEIVDDDLRFLRWSSGVDHPKTLALEDLPAIRESADLFARKVAAEEDPRLFTALRERTRAAVRH